jgi:predicted nucleotidyltransferase
MRATEAGLQRLDGDLAQVLARVSADEESIVAASVFGSHARGTVTPLSDIDVALLRAPGAAAADVCERVADTLSRHLATDRVDVIPLNHAPLPLRYRVVREGILVAGRDAARLERFVADAVRQYLDVQPLRERAFQILHKKICNTAFSTMSVDEIRKLLGIYKLPDGRIYWIDPSVIDPATGGCRGRQPDERAWIRRADLLQPGGW